jgi:hypothetical protein
MTQQLNSEKATKYLQTGLRVGLYAAIGVGSVLGIPPFVAGVDALMGRTLESWGDIASSSQMISSLAWWGTGSVFALGGYGIWQSRLPMFKKMIGLAGCATVLSVLAATPAADVTASLIGALVPAVGVTIWGCVQAVQLFMLMLHNNEPAMKRMFGKLVDPKESEYDDSLSAAQNRIKKRFAANKVAIAYAFFSTAGVLGYVAEVAVNLIYGQSASVNWMAIFAPGGVLNLGWQLVQAAVVLAFTIGSIEACAMGLLYLEQMTEAIKE